MIVQNIETVQVTYWEHMTADQAALLDQPANTTVWVWDSRTDEATEYFALPELAGDHEVALVFEVAS
jgi:hypothetical protein